MKHYDDQLEFRNVRFGSGGALTSDSKHFSNQIPIKWFISLLPPFFFCVHKGFRLHIANTSVPQF